MAKWIVEAECMANIWKGMCTITPLSVCKDCRYAGDRDEDDPKYLICKYYTDIVNVYYMLEDDYCSCWERMDEVEE